MTFVVDVNRTFESDVHGTFELHVQRTAKLDVLGTSKKRLSDFRIGRNSNEHRSNALPYCTFLKRLISTNRCRFFLFATLVRPGDVPCMSVWETATKSISCIVLTIVESGTLGLKQINCNQDDNYH